MMVTIQHLPPSFPGIFGQINSSAFTMLAGVASPCGKIEAIRVSRIDGQAVWSIVAIRHGDARPSVGRVRGLIDRAVSLVSDASIFGTTGDQKIKRALGI